MQKVPERNRTRTKTMNNLDFTRNLQKQLLENPQKEFLKESLGGTSAKMSRRNSQNFSRGDSQRNLKMELLRNLYQELPKEFPGGTSGGIPRLQEKSSKDTPGKAFEETLEGIARRIQRNLQRRLQDKSPEEPPGESLEGTPEEIPRRTLKANS